MDYGQRLVHLVDAKYEFDEQDDGMRYHLGASVLGEKCMRQVWFSYRWADGEKFDGRMLRLFARGQREEEVFVDLLRRMGAEVWTHDPQGNQFRTSTLNGHTGGSLDGVARMLPELPSYVPKDAPVLLEMKTHNDKSFKLLLSKGLKESKPKHYRQAQIYLGGTGIKYCLYCAVNKNDDSLWFYFFEFDPSEYTYLTQRGESIVFGHGTPPRISETPSWHECRFCSMRGVCFGQKMPRVNCRTCAHASPQRDGTWGCARGQELIKDKEQAKKGCDLHMFHPMFIPHAKVVEFAGTHVAYSHRGQVILNGPGHVSSECLDLTC